MRISPQHSTVYHMLLVSAAIFLTDTACLAEDHEHCPIETGDLILIPVDVFGNRYSFALDSGCSCTVFDIAFRGRVAEAGPSTKVETRHGEFESFHAPAMTIGTAAPKSFRSSRAVVCLDLANIREASEQTIDGILGMDFLESHVLRINPDRGRATLQSEVTSLPAHVEQMRRAASGCPRITVWVSEMGLQSVLVDTGLSNSVKLETGLFNELLRRKRIVLRSDTEVTNAGGIVRQRTGILDVIALGPYQVGNVRVTEDRLINSIGRDFLDRFDTEFDFPNSRAYFRPSSRLYEPDRENLSGLWIARENGKNIVEFVEAESNAAKSDIRKGDELLEIHEKSVSNWTTRRLFVPLSQSGTELKLTLKRDGEISKVTLQLPQITHPFPMPEPVPQLKQDPELISVP